MDHKYVYYLTSPTGLSLLVRLQQHNLKLPEGPEDYSLF